MPRRQLRSRALRRTGCNILRPLDDYLVVGNVSGKTQTVEAVFRSTWLELTRLAYLLVGNRSEAEDIVQSVFTTAVTRWEAIEEPGAYLRRAVVNRANEVHRRSARSPATALPQIEWIDAAEIDELWESVCALPASQRAVIVLRFYEDLALGDIAELLGRPSSTVRSDLRRALSKLRGSIE